MPVALISTEVVAAVEVQNFVVDDKNGVLNMMIPDCGCNGVAGIGKRLHVGCHVAGGAAVYSVECGGIDSLQALRGSDKDRIQLFTAAVVSPHFFRRAKIGLHQKGENSVQKKQADQETKAFQQNASVPPERECAFCRTAVLLLGYSGIRNLHTGSLPQIQ